MPRVFLWDMPNHETTVLQKCQKFHPTKSWQIHIKPALVLQNWQQHRYVHNVVERIAASQILQDVYLAKNLPYKKFVIFTPPIILCFTNI